MTTASPSPAGIKDILLISKLSSSISALGPSVIRTATLPVPDGAEGLPDELPPPPPPQAVIRAPRPIKHNATPIDLKNLLVLIAFSFLLVCGFPKKMLFGFERICRQH